MQQLIIIIHVLAALGISGLVLLQQGKGAEMGASFGSGASNTVFGSVGSLPFLVKLTALLAAVFFATSLGLNYLVSRQQHNMHSGLLGGTPAASTLHTPESTKSTAPIYDLPNNSMGSGEKHK